MTKQETIQKAFGKHWEFVKTYVDENGWCDDVWRGQLKTVYDDLDVKWFGSTRFRPKSLTGIEHNNGWIKIESENDLPKSDFEMFHVIFTPSGGIGKHLWNDGKWCGCDGRKSKGNVSHYKTIDEPQPPIY